MTLGINPYNSPYSNKQKLGFGAINKEKALKTAEKLIDGANDNIDKFNNNNTVKKGKEVVNTGIENGKKKVEEIINSKPVQDGIKTVKDTTNEIINSEPVQKGKEVVNTGVNKIEETTKEILNSKPVQDGKKKVEEFVNSESVQNAKKKIGSFFNKFK